MNPSTDALVAFIVAGAAQAALVVTFLLGVCAVVCHG